MMLRMSLKQLHPTFINPETGWVTAFGAAIAPFITYLYGDGSGLLLKPLIIIIVLDWISGVIAAHRDKTYTSEYGIQGIFRTLFILLFPALANVLDQILMTPGEQMIFYGVTFGLMYHILQSATANAVRCGWDRWIPLSVMNLVMSEVQAKTERAATRKLKHEKMIPPEVPKEDILLSHEEIEDKKKDVAP